MRLSSISDSARPLHCRWRVRTQCTPWSAYAELHSRRANPAAVVARRRTSRVYGVVNSNANSSSAATTHSTRRAPRRAKHDGDRAPNRTLPAASLRPDTRGSFRVALSPKSRAGFADTMLRPAARARTGVHYHRAAGAAHRARRDRAGSPLSASGGADRGVFPKHLYTPIVLSPIQPARIRHARAPPVRAWPRVRSEGPLAA